MALRIRQLEPSDDRSSFDSGNIELDRFFQRYAGQNQFRHHVGSTYVAVDGDRILGYATVAASEITGSRVPSKKKKLPRYPLPVLRLARMATAKEYQGKGVGKMLLAAVFTLAHQMAEGFGCVGVVVDAKLEAVTFYEKLGFVPLDTVSGQLGDRPEPHPMFVELGAIPKP